MIKFFRKTREQLLSENKFSGYLKYAIGEIVLVVLGILIALYINNLNEQRKTENRIVEILKEIQNDLGKNILEADNTIAYYKNKKSKILRLLNDKITYDEFKNNPLASKFLLFGSSHIKLYDNGYKNLMQNANSIPDKYKEIVNPLNELYIYDKYEIDKFDTQITQIISDLYNTLASRPDWYSEATSLTISDDLIDYFSTSDYKNYAYTYTSNSWVLLSGTLSRFRYNAVDVYLEIAKLIGNQDEVPEYISHNFIKMEPKSLEQYAGIYSLITSDNDNRSASKSKFRISLKGNHLVFVSMNDSGTETDIYIKSADEGYDKNGNEFQFARNKDSTVTSFTRARYFTLITGLGVSHYEKNE